MLPQTRTLINAPKLQFVGRVRTKPCRALASALSLTEDAPIAAPVAASRKQFSGADNLLDRSLCVAHGRLGDQLPVGDGSYVNRMVGPTDGETAEMLQVVGGVKSLEELTDKVIPFARCAIGQGTDDVGRGLPEMGLSERKAQELVTDVLNLNEHGWRSFLGAHHYNTHTPAVLVNNVLMNPSWYSAYTPYQAEISQGRLEALYNFQTIFAELAGLPVANAGLLDVASAAVEAVLMAIRSTSTEKRSVLVDRGVCPLIVDVLRTRLKPLETSIVDFDIIDGVPAAMNGVAALIYQSPDVAGRIVSNISRIASQCHDFKAKVIAVTDPLALALFEPPGRQGADIVLGSSQRFGVPMGNGGPAAAYLAVTNELIRQIPGRLVAATEDSHGQKAFRLALQTREQHIRRENATSNICTAQSLPAVMAQFWVAYTGSDAIKALAKKVYRRTAELAAAAREFGFSVEGENSWLRHGRHFGVVSIRRRDLSIIRKWAEHHKLNFAFDYEKGVCRIHVDELLCDDDVYKTVLDTLYKASRELSLFSCATIPLPVDPPVVRSTPFLDCDRWRKGMSDTEMLRMVVDMGNRDIGLQTSMIPLGSCTMKHNPTSALSAAFHDANTLTAHPLAPAWQKKGSLLIASMLTSWLCQLTGLDHCSLQPNSGSVGELAGLHAIREYLNTKGESQRKLCVIPASAHGTNSASAALAGFNVVELKLTENGHIDLQDLRRIVTERRNEIGCIMITFPSTYGLFEEEVLEATRIIHDAGGLVYVDGANLNAQMGLTSPGNIGADACHLNLHKTFGIPHGGGGPGVGPVCVASKLVDFLPSHRYFSPFATQLRQMGLQIGRLQGAKPPIAFTHAPFGSASLLVIPWVYLLLMGKKGLTKSSQTALLNANYLRRLLASAGLSVCNPDDSYCGHEFILDLQGVGKANLTEEDIAKRLMDYGFHAPTMSWPKKRALMIEPTECESKKSLDAFAKALISIQQEVKGIINGDLDKEDNPLKKAPHTLRDLIAGHGVEYRPIAERNFLPLVAQAKYWPPVNRTNGEQCDRDLVKQGRS